MKPLRLAAGAVALTSPLTLAAPAEAQNRNYNQQVRECNRDLRRADSRAEYRRELRQCQRESAACPASGRARLAPLQRSTIITAMSRGQRAYYADRVIAMAAIHSQRRLGYNDRIYRGQNGSYYCRRNDGTTGLIVGAGIGARSAIRSTSAVRRPFGPSLAARSARRSARPSPAATSAVTKAKRPQGRAGVRTGPFSCVPCLPAYAAASFRPKEQAMRSHVERHLVQRIGWLRAAVLGANDGIVSTASLIVGVAAAASGKAGRARGRRRPGRRRDVDGGGRICVGQLAGRHRAGRSRPRARRARAIARRRAQELRSSIRQRGARHDRRRGRKAVDGEGRARRPCARRTRHQRCTSARPVQAALAPRPPLRPARFCRCWSPCCAGTDHDLAVTAARSFPRLAWRDRREAAERRSAGPPCGSSSGARWRWPSPPASASWSEPRFSRSPPSGVALPPAAVVSMQVTRSVANRAT